MHAHTSIATVIELPNWSPEERAVFHSCFRAWCSQASSDEFDKLEQLREQVAPGEVCSMVRLVRAGFRQPDLRDQLPAALVGLLQERRLLPASSAVQGA
ncbi:MAG: hypothetical protein ACLGJD_10875 [Gammaproteobacteria bacterium]|uniref:hypothetical protein n=1 Tax=uncultured Pseudacidovorax sp. TaxID=679313 RepID=UPI0025E636E2|nr:hypothetical protein [uncultured Pseudacidovorax sp.]